MREALARLEEWRREFAELPEDELPERLLERSGLRSAWGLRDRAAQALANLDKAAASIGAEVRDRGATLEEAGMDMAERLGSGEDADQGVSEEKADAVAVMTIHAAKGLERDHVFVASLDRAA